MEADPAGRRPAQGLQLRGRISGGGLQCFEWCPPSSCPLAPRNVTLFGNSVFAAVIKVKILRWDDFRFRVGPTSTDWCPFKKTHTHTHTRSYVTTEQRQVTATSQSHLGPPGLRGGRKCPPLEPLEGAWPCDTLISAQ